jgi:hypothetical protein
MPTDLRIACSCGALRAVANAVSGQQGNHAVCYCDDCQAFAHFLGRADQILDPQGGTQIFQMSPASLSIEAGADRLACMRLGPSGLFRWYTSCCKTPIGNTLPTGKIPFIGLIHLCIQRPVDDESLERALGPVRARVHRRFAKGDPAALPAATNSLPFAILRIAGLFLKWRLRGDQHHSPFFEPGTGKAVVVPHVLSVTERDELRRLATGASS